MGFGRPVMYAFVISEKYASLRVMFQLFRDMMGMQYPISTMVMDKFAPQMRAAPVVFGCDVLLCYFHVRQAISKHVSMPVLLSHCFRPIAIVVGIIFTEWSHVTRRSSKCNFLCSLLDSIAISKS